MAAWTVEVDVVVLTALDEVETSPPAAAVGPARHALAVLQAIASHPDVRGFCVTRDAVA